MTPLFEATGLRPASATLPERPCRRSQRLVDAMRQIGLDGDLAAPAQAAGGQSQQPALGQVALGLPQRQPAQPRPARIMACLVPLTRQVCGDSTAKSRPWLNGEASVCTICTWSASSAGSSICPATTRPASAWPAPTTATICTEDSACTAMRGSRKCSPAMMPRAWLRSSRAAIAAQRQHRDARRHRRVARMRHSAAPTWAMGNSVSTTSGSSSSTPSPSPCARARMASTRSRMSRALASSAWPCGVMTGRLPWRSNSDTPSSDSMLAMAWLTADCTRDSWRAAARKLPASATAANTRNWSRVRGVQHGRQ